MDNMIQDCLGLRVIQYTLCPLANLDLALMVRQCTLPVRLLRMASEQLHLFLYTHTPTHTVAWFELHYFISQSMFGGIGLLLTTRE